MKELCNQEDIIGNVLHLKHLKNHIYEAGRRSPNCLPNEEVEIPLAV